MSNQNDRFLIADLEAQRKELTDEVSLEQKIEAIDVIVTKVLKTWLSAGITNQCECIVVNVKHKEAAEWIARKYQLQLVTSFVFPDNRVNVCRRDEVEILITSQTQKENERPKIVNGKKT